LQLGVQMIFDLIKGIVDILGSSGATGVSLGQVIDLVPSKTSKPLLLPKQEPKVSAPDPKAAAAKQAQAVKLAQEAAAAKAEAARLQEQAAAAKATKETMERKAAEEKATAQARVLATPPPVTNPVVPTSTLSKIIPEAAPAVTNTSVVSIAKKDAPPPYTTERLGTMDNPKKMNAAIEELKKDGTNWHIESAYSNPVITNGTNSYSVGKDQLSTTDVDIKTYKAMLTSFKEMYPGEQPQINIDPALKDLWQKACDQTGIKAAFNLTVATPAATEKAEAAPTNTPSPNRP
jgi:hypothetical protein